MATRILTAFTLAALLAGCGGGGAKPTDPKLGSGVKEDPRLKPAAVGGAGSNSKGPATAP